MSKSFLIIGLGRFGQSTARMLTTLGHEVLAVDKRADRVSAMKDSVMHAVQADTTDERAIAQLGIRNFDCVVICIGDDIRASVLATVLCREMGAKKIVAKAQDDLHQKLLIKTGADRVVQPEHDGGIRLARSLVAEGVLDSLDLSEEYSINEVEIPKDINLKRGTEVRIRFYMNENHLLEVYLEIPSIELNKKYEINRGGNLSEEEMRELSGLIVSKKIR